MPPIATGLPIPHTSKVAASYLLRHRTAPRQGIMADAARQDPYVWDVPWLWSFCHANQRMHLGPGSTIFWCSQIDGRYCCDLVFVIGKLQKLREAEAAYADRPHVLIEHFLPGERWHSKYASKPQAFCAQADISRSFVPQPPPDIEEEVARLRAAAGRNPSMRNCWRYQTGPLCIDEPDELVAYVGTHCGHRIDAPIGAPASTAIPLPVLDLASAPVAKA